MLSPRQLQTLLLFNFCAIILLGGALIAIASIFFTDSEFIAFSDNENSAEKVSDFHDTYLIPCTNKTEGDEIREFDGKTIIASNCQQSINVCLVNICKADRTCEERLIATATCSQDSNCDPGFKCDLDICSCVESPSCSEDSNCPVVDNNSCAGFSCVDETCRLITLSGNECSTNQECSENEICGPSCTCVPFNSCSVDSDCQVVNNTACAGFECINEICTLVTLDGNECSTSQECGQNEFCGVGCVCTSSANIQCSEDTNCPIVNNNDCANFTCVNETCVLDTLAGNECSTNQECLTGQYCAPGCSCAFVNSTSGTCETNEDCDDVNSTSCANFTCVMGKCTFGTIDGNECSTAQDCGTDEFCGLGCICVSSGSSSANLSWSVYTPIVNTSISTLTVQSFIDGVYYRVNDGFIEMQLYVEFNSSTTASISKEFYISTPIGITLDTSTLGVGVFTIASTSVHSVDSTVYPGTGSSFIFSANEIGFNSLGIFASTGTSTVPHTGSATFVGKLT